MLILPKIKFKRDPEELEEKLEEDLEEDLEEEPEEEAEAEPEIDSEEEAEELPEEEPAEDAPLETVTEAVPMPEKPKRVREKKPKPIVILQEIEDGVHLSLMLGEEKQEELFLSSFEDDESSPTAELTELTFEQIGKRIRKTLKDNKIRVKRAAYVIPEEEARIRYITMPLMPEKQIRFNLPVEFRQDFPEGLSGKLFDYAHLLEEETEEGIEQGEGPLEGAERSTGEEDTAQKNPDEMELVAAAVPAECMERARTIFGAAGLRLLMAAPESLSEESFFPKKPKDRKRKAAINFAHLGEKRMHPAGVAAIAAALILLALGIAKFGIIDRYSALQKSLQYTTELKEKVEAGKAELSAAADTKEEYAHYTWSQMTDEECEQIERIRIGALLNFIAGQGARVKSAALSGTLLTVSVTADSLEAISTLTQAIEEQDIVESCSVTTAEKEEQSDEVNYAAPPSDVMEVEVDDSVPVEETAPEGEKPERKDKNEQTQTEDGEEPAEGEEESEEGAEELPEIEYPEGTVEAQLRIYLKKRSETLGASEDISAFEDTASQEVVAAEEAEDAIEGEEAEPVEEDTNEEETLDDEGSSSQDEAEGEDNADETLPTITMDENGNPIIVDEGNTGETY